MHRVFARLQADYVAANKVELFECLQGCLPGSQAELSYAQASKALGMQEGTLREYAKRLRNCHLELLRAEIAAIVSSPEEIECSMAACNHYSFGSTADQHYKREAWVQNFPQSGLF